MFFARLAPMRGCHTRSFSSVPVNVYRCTSPNGHHKALHFPKSHMVLFKKDDILSHDQFTFTSMEELKEKYSIELIQKVEAPPYIMNNLRSLSVARKRSEDEQERILHYLTNVSSGIEDVTEEIWSQINSD